MLKKLLLALDNEMVKHAMDAVARPYGDHVEFEAGRRQGVSQGLRVARAKVEELLKGDDEHDEAGRDGKAVRRLG